ncbi:hypothetical protein ACWCQP_47405 [Streptomyces chartreusis]
MSRHPAPLDDRGLSLWMTDWKVASTGLPWLGRRFVALVGGAVAGHLDYALHPDGQALTVGWINVFPQFQGAGLAGVLMDALYAAHPTAWINQGWRTPEGAQWWNSYREPAPERNIHNQPPAAWATYFNAVDVAADKAQNAHLDNALGLHGHQDAVYRYGERTEDEALRFAPAHRPYRAANADPSAYPLHGAVRLLLDSRLHSYIHDPAVDRGQRVWALLEHLGHGNLPREWNATRHAAFEDAYHEEVFQDEPGAPDDSLSLDTAEPRPTATHVVFSVRPLPEGQQPPHHGQVSWLNFTGPADIDLEVTEVSWRSADEPAITHTADFTPAVHAAIAPLDRSQASTGYRARYDTAGFLRQASAQQPQSAHPYAHRAAEIRNVAERLTRQVADRTPTAPPSANRGVVLPDAQHQVSPRSPGTGPR